MKMSVMLALAVWLAVGCDIQDVRADGKDGKEVRVLCSAPASPIDPERLKALARAELKKREKRQYPNVDVSWGERTCAWLVTAATENAGPGDHRIMIFSNAGVLQSYHEGM